MKQEKQNSNLAFQTWLAWTIKQVPAVQTQWLEQFQQFAIPDVLNQNLAPFKEAYETILPKGLLTAISQEAETRFYNFIKGINLYKQSSYRRLASDPPVIWQKGSTRLLDYGNTSHANVPIVLCIPSLVNRSYILDLEEDNSMMRFLAEQNLRPLLVDWGEMSDEEREFNLEDYIEQNLNPILEFLGPQPIYVVGYCMGGLLATALAQLNPNVKRLILLATPWDFHVDQDWLIPYLKYCSEFLEHMINSSNELSVEMVQFMLNSLNPLSIVRKFRTLGEKEQNTETLEKFSAVEDWLNDCVPLAPRVAKECLFGWYRDNEPHHGNWRISGQTIAPENLNIPTLAIIPQRDVIVPPSSAQALASKISYCQVLKPSVGHIGAIVGRAARKEVWEPMAHFLKTNL